MSGLNTQVVNASSVSCLGNLVVPYPLDFRTATQVEVDFSSLLQQGFLDFVSGVYVDNWDSAEELIITCSGSRQRIIVPGNTQMYVPLLIPNDPVITITAAVSPAMFIPLFAYNMPLLPWINGANIGSPLTDDELRAAPVEVAATLPLNVTPTQPIGGAYTDRSIANLTGASQVLMAANANRRILVINNVGATSIGINAVGGAAAIGTAGTITVLTGGSLVLDSYPPTGAINIIGTLNADVTAYEG